TSVRHSLEALAIFWTVLGRTTVLPPTSSLPDLYLGKTYNMGKRIREHARILRARAPKIERLMTNTEQREKTVEGPIFTPGQEN
uniref:Uncharacterized protein n=1 Tax=Cucumis melo TaxID=3656 RepID=A0A9I9E3E2_CUCME